jgi:hypothetical protein
MTYYTIEYTVIIDGDKVFTGSIGSISERTTDLNKGPIERYYRSEYPDATSIIVKFTNDKVAVPREDYKKALMKFMV